MAGAQPDVPQNSPDAQACESDGVSQPPQCVMSRDVSTQCSEQQVLPLPHVCPSPEQRSLHPPAAQTRSSAHSESRMQWSQSWLVPHEPLAQLGPFLQPGTHAKSTVQ